MTFSKYQQQMAPGTYLQTVLGALVQDPQPRFAMLPIGPMAEDMNKGIDQGLLRQLVQAAELGTATRAQLFVSPAGALSQLHYDQYDNLFFQVSIPMPAVAASSTLAVFSPVCILGSRV